MKKLRTEKNDEEDIQRGIDFEFKAENSTDLLKHLVKQATPDDIYCDYLYFVRNLPQLLNNQSTELIHLVRKELNIAEVQKNLVEKSTLRETNSLFLTHCPAKLAQTYEIFSLRQPLYASCVKGHLQSTMLQLKFHYTPSMDPNWQPSTRGNVEPVAALGSSTLTEMSMGISSTVQIKESSTMSICMETLTWAIKCIQRRWE